MNRLITLALTLSLAGLAGCSSLTTPQPKMVWAESRQLQPTPAAHLPASMRVENWTGTSLRGSRGGSCAHAATHNAYLACGNDAWLAIWRAKKNSGYEGPETDWGMMRKWNAEGIPYISTENAEEWVLEAATRTRRAGPIWYYDSHSITFHGIGYVPNKRQPGTFKKVAVMMDNNSPSKYIRVDWDVFMRSWPHFGGWVGIPWGHRSTPYTFRRLYPDGS